MRILYNIILFLVGVIAIFVVMREPYFKLEEAVFPAIIFGIFARAIKLGRFRSLVEI